MAPNAPFIASRRRLALPAARADRGLSPISLHYNDRHVQHSFSALRRHHPSRTRAHGGARDISDAMLLQVIDHGETRYRDSTHLWAFMEFPERNDNLLCAVVVLVDAVVVKTVMHHFSIL